MSTTDAGVETALPLECPVIDGRRQIQRLPARASSVGGIPVARLLPLRERRLIGAWCFLDHIGPARFAPGTAGLRVGPHPHIGLQTFTWMIAGEILHRDSLGYEQLIRPGQVNLMTAGDGVSHTEETPPHAGTSLHAVQLWIALPRAERAVEPRFDHYPELPRFSLGAFNITLLTGRCCGHEAPALQYSPLLGLELSWSGPGRAELPLRQDFEYGLLPLEGMLSIDETSFVPGELAYLGMRRESLVLQSDTGGRALLVGGTPLGEEVVIWWNFVAGERTTIEHARRDWDAGSTRFGTVSGYDGPRLEAPEIPWLSAPVRGH
ncbi:MAG: pirin family protein [Chromatiales bacterium]|nr:pirin family protein [Chromatiales bacterium]